MDTCFEAWVETIAAWTARRVGATVHSDRTQQTRIPLDWTPPGSGSQRSVLSDVVLRRDDVVVILDAKDKQHASDIERLGWGRVSDAVQERHRTDLLQALAYSTLFDAPRIVTMLVYPCGVEAYRRLMERERVMQVAKVRTAPRNVEVGLMAVPLGGEVSETGEALARWVHLPTHLGSDANFAEWYVAEPHSAQMCGSECNLCEPKSAHGRRVRRVASCLTWVVGSDQGMRISASAWCVR